MFKDLKNNSHFNYIDELRGIAILLVIIVHTSESIKNLSPLLFGILSFGQMGVQLFFILSAYTLCLSYSYSFNEPNKKKTFYLKRFFRIVPLYYLGIILYFFINQICKADWSLNHQFSYNFKSIVSNILLLNGFYPPGTNSVVPGGWSIGTEMAFYSVFPLLYYLYFKIKNLQWLIALTFVVFCFIYITVLFFERTLLIPVYNNGFIYFNIYNQLPVFLVGITYYFYSEKQILKPNNGYYSLFLFILTFIICIYCFNFYFSVTLIPFISSISFVFLFNTFKYKKKAYKVLGKIGQFSFSIYLFHYLFAWGLSVDINSLLTGILNPSLILLVCLIVTIMCSFIIAHFSNNLIEKPGINLGKRILMKIQLKYN